MEKSLLNRAKQLPTFNPRNASPHTFTTKTSLKVQSPWPHLLPLEAGAARAHAPHLHTVDPLRALSHPCAPGREPAAEHPPITTDGITATALEDAEAPARVEADLGPGVPVESGTGGLAATGRGVTRERWIGGARRRRRLRR
jgi:hypothetical protein